MFVIQMDNTQRKCVVIGILKPFNFRWEDHRTSLHLFVDCVRALYGDVSSGL